MAERFIRTLKLRGDATSSAWTRQRNPPLAFAVRASMFVLIPIRHTKNLAQGKQGQTFGSNSTERSALGFSPPSAPPRTSSGIFGGPDHAHALRL